MRQRVDAQTAGRMQMLFTQAMCSVFRSLVLERNAKSNTARLATRYRRLCQEVMTVHVYSKKKLNSRRQDNISSIRESRKVDTFRNNLC